MKRVKVFLQQKRVLVPAGIIIFLLLLYNAFVNHNEPTEIGIARNLVSGEMWIQDGGGFYVNPPWVWVSRVDTTPMRLGVTSAGRGYSAKLVQFDKTHWKDFVEVEGWRFWWLSNRISFNFGYEEEYRGMRDIMRGYAYSPKKHLFLVVHAEYDAK